MVPVEILPYFLVTTILITKLNNSVWIIVLLFNVPLLLLFLNKFPNKGIILITDVAA